MRGRVGILIALGDHDAAFAKLERDIAARRFLPPRWVDPAIDPLRADPRFVRLATMAGRPADRLAALGRGEPAPPRGR